MHRLTRVPRPKSLILALTVVGLLIAEGVPATIAQDEAPVPSASSEPVHGWPGTTAAPSGLYSYRVGSDGPRFMHWVPAGWTADAPNSVELVFLSGQADEDPGLGAAPVSRAWWRQDRYGTRPARAPDVLTQAWLFDVGDMRVAIELTSYRDTDPALLAEAVAVVRSIAVEPADDGTSTDLVFRLGYGWDSG